MGPHDGVKSQGGEGGLDGASEDEVHLDRRLLQVGLRVTDKQRREDGSAKHASHLVSAGRSTHNSKF